LTSVFQKVVKIHLMTLVGRRPWDLTVVEDLGNQPPGRSKGVAFRQTFSYSWEEGNRPMGMSEEHKQAIARGRVEARAVKDYLEALGHRRRGRPVNRETLQQRLTGITGQLETEPDPMRRVELVQARIDLEDHLAAVTAEPDFADLEREFVKHVKPYSERKSISYSAWREVGVPAKTLKAAGIRETRRR